MLMQRAEPFGRSVTPRRRVQSAVVTLVVRCFTAFLGGYAWTAGLVTLVARLLPLSRVEATVWAMVPAFLVYALLALWCFHEPRIFRVAAMVWGGALVLGGLIWLLGVRP